MALKIIKETTDARGKIIWLEANDKEIHFVETRKGYARGGHYHPFDSMHIIISGTVIYKETDMKGLEKEKRCGPGSLISTPANMAHMMTAVEDTIFVEIFEPPYRAVNFAPYREVVEKTFDSSS